MPESLLRFVTITGADDGVDPNDLIGLSKDFPFVEWGLLCSRKREATARYPSPAWIQNFSRILGAGPFPQNLSFHLCGSMARETLSGDATYIEAIAEDAVMVRVQVNGLLPTPPVGEYEGGQVPLVNFARRFPRVEFIAQTGGPQTLMTASCMAQYYAPNISALVDGSGGRGVAIGVPFASWIDAAARWAGGTDPIRLGFAGGIDAHNVTAVLREAHRRGHPFWIDCESGARTDDRFDLTKAEAVLKAASEFRRWEQLTRTEPERTWEDYDHA